MVATPSASSRVTVSDIDVPLSRRTVLAAILAHR
jgi:hypothetical protein